MTNYDFAYFTYDFSYYICALSLQIWHDFWCTFKWLFPKILENNTIIGCWEIWTCDLMIGNRTCYPLNYETLYIKSHKILALTLQQEVNTYIVERGVKSEKVNRTNPVTTNLKSMFVTYTLCNMSKFCTITLSRS